MNIIKTLFQPIYGKQCWKVRSGIGSFITLEFGEPHFRIIREPYAADDPRRKNPKLRRNADRRLVSIDGDWQIWIYCCAWNFYWNDHLIGTSDAKKSELAQIALDLEGQALRSVRADRSGKSIFEFDLGGRLETHPYSVENNENEPEDQWMLYEPSGMVFTFRSDGRYQHLPGNTPPVNEWFLLD